MMKENKLTIFINKPVKKVFEYSLESTNVSKWITSIKEEIPSERPVKVGTKLRNIGVNSDSWNFYEVIDFEQDKTFTLKRLNGDYFVRYTCTEKNNGTDFEYFEWAENKLDGLMEMSALELLKELIENDIGLLESKQLIENNPMHIATVSSDNKPNLSIASDVRVLEENKIIISHNEMVNTPKNLLTNKNIVLTSFNEKWEGLRMTGIADYYIDGKYYNFCEKLFFGNVEVPLFGATKPKGAIVVTIEKCEEIK